MALKTPISVLQELMVAKGKPFPDYTFQNIGNLCNPQFSCTVKAGSVTAIAAASNKKEAKQKAAASALQQLQKLDDKLPQTIPEYPIKVITNFVFKDPPANFQNGLNYVGKMNEFAARHRCSTGVRYEDVPYGSSGMFQVKCTFNNVDTFGYALNKKQAKHIAAFEMLEKLKTMKIEPVTHVKTEEDVKVIEAFAKLSLSQTMARQQKENVEAISALTVANRTLEEAKEKLKKLNFNYHVETLQKNPFVVAVQLRENSVTALGSGESERVATVNALNRVLGTLSVGCSFTS